MKPVYKCDWCKTMGTEEEILEHEKTCMANINLHSCYTCANRKGLAALECKAGMRISEEELERIDYKKLKEKFPL